MKTEILEIKVTADLSEFPVLMPKAEADALREAVEVLEGIDRTALLRHEIAWLKDYNDVLRDVATEYGDGYFAALEAVEVLEDMYAQRDAETEKWFQKWMDGVSDLWRSQAALRDAEARVKELHEEVARQQQRGDELQDERNDYADRLRKVNGESIRANKWRSLYEDAERDIQTLKPDYDAEGMIRFMASVVQRG